MPEFIDVSTTTPAKRRRTRLLILLAILFSILILGRIALSYWVDLLWFASLGYADVFWRTLGFKALIFALTLLVTFFLLSGAFLVIRRSHQDELPSAHAIVFGDQTISLSVKPALRLISLAVSVFIALTSATAMMAEWPALALVWYAPHAPAASPDPIFGRSLPFFLFTLPGWQLVLNWLLTLAVTTCAVAVLFLLITSGSRTLGKRKISDGNSPWRGLSITGACLLLTMAVWVYVGRFEHVFDHHTVFDGVNYTDAHITIPGMLLVCAALVFGAGLLAFNALRISRGLWLVASIAPAVLCYLAVGLVGWYVDSFIVKPNQLVRERSYIADNIAGTRQAYGLDRVTRQEFPAETAPGAADPANNQPTLKNIRLWDWRALQDTLRQVQEIRTYYDFPEIDIDRYDLNGSKTEVMLAARELNVDNLPVSSRNWINEKLIYTHGYGLTMNPVNGFTPEGLPDLLLSNMPVQSTVPGLKVTRPEVYFGELTDTDVYVKTRQQEFDYPQGQSNSLTSYQGSGGILLGGFLRRVVLALDRGDLGTLPFSDDVHPDSRLLMIRNIRDRVEKLAPFLTFDQDPYLVVGDNGRLSWVMDAYTTSDTYPESTHYNLGDDSVNYMRNSVKAVVDAYNGTATFYVFDHADPVIATYRRIFPTLFKDAAAMPADLRRHVRYPETLFRLQSEVYGLYHMTIPEVFFNREDLWAVATETRTDADGQQSVQPMQPNYVLMKLPGETGEEFVEILPFTPANRNNLIGWMAGRSDGAHYGDAIVYDFPKTRLIDGPQQIEARIDQNAQLSGQLTLWNQQGSHVLRGSLLVIPSGRALLYAEPIYLQAQQSPMPELRLVVLALQDQLAYGTTFQAALASLFGGEPSSLSGSEASTPSPTPPLAAGVPAQPADMRSLIDDAGKDFEDYQRLTSAGRLGEAGQKLDALKGILQQLSARQK